MRYRSHPHCVFSIQFHLVLVTKYRRKCFTPEILSRLEDICKNLCSRWDIDLVEFGGEEDHIHLLLDFHPNVLPATFVGNLKTVTSRLIRKEFAEHLEKYYWKPILWTRAYCLLSAGGANIEVIRNYIEKQGLQSP